MGDACDFYESVARDGENYCDIDERLMSESLVEPVSPKPKAKQHEENSEMIEITDEEIDTVKEMRQKITPNQSDDLMEYELPIAFKHLFNNVVQSIQSVTGKKDITKASIKEWIDDCDGAYLWWIENVNIRVDDNCDVIIETMDKDIIDSRSLRELVVPEVFIDYIEGCDIDYEDMDMSPENLVFSMEQRSLGLNSITEFNEKITDVSKDYISSNKN